MAKCSSKVVRSSSIAVDAAVAPEASAFSAFCTSVKAAAMAGSTAARFIPSLVGLVKSIESRNILLTFFEERFGDRFDVIYSGPENIELMPKNISKGQALLELMELKGYEPTEVACIGDSMNDITMLQATPFSFAMRHSDDIVKESSHYVVKTVAEAIEMVLKYNRGETSGL